MEPDAIAVTNRQCQIKALTSENTSMFDLWQIPAPKKPTRWEEYARVKGINKRKRSRMVWDETAKEWRPRWGYKRANDNTKDWCIELPDQVGEIELLLTTA